MRKPSICADIGIIEMTSSNQTQDTGESRIERMRKFLSSPLTRKKSSVVSTKVFGVPLEALIQRSPTDTFVPYIITRICQFIEKSGMAHEGIFRTSGNARLMERLKSSFDQSGDAPLETEGDVPSAAGLLKLFLRELPDPLIPLNMHQAFLSIVKVFSDDKEECVHQIKLMVNRLPLVNYHVLKYLAHFLLKVTQMEEQNRMGASALGIVFGPNLFRVTEDFSGLKEQSLTNQIVTCFISEYNMIFEGGAEVLYVDESPKILPETLWKQKSAKSPTLKQVEKLSAMPFEDRDSHDFVETLSVEIPTLDEDFLPGSCELQQQMITSEALRVDSLIERAISQTVTDHLFGIDGETGQDDDTGVSSRRKRKERKVSEEEMQVLCSQSEEALSVGSEDNFNRRREGGAFQTDGHEIFGNVVNGKNHIQNIQDFKNSSEEILFKKISNYHNNTELSPHPPKPKRREIEPYKSDHTFNSNVQYQIPSSTVAFDYHENMHGHEILDYNSVESTSKNSGFRVPHSKTDGSSDRELKDKILPNDHGHPKQECDLNGFVSAKYISNKQFEHGPNALSEQVVMAEVHSNSNFYEELSDYAESQRESNFKSDYGYSNSLDNGENVSGLDSHSASSNHHHERSSNVELETTTKDCLPPSTLDLTQDVHDGHEPAYSDQHRFSWPTTKGFRDDSDDAVLSPFPHHFRKTSSYEAPLSPSAYKSYLSHRCLDLDSSLPPSPPVEQEDFIKNISEDSSSVSTRQLTKKIHSLKKKIKQFEENFESEHGYRPSHAEKMNYPDVKKLISDLSKARKELKNFKDESPILRSADVVHSAHWSSSTSKTFHVDQQNKGTSTKFSDSGGSSSSDKPKPTVQESLKETMKILAEKRRIVQRPESLEDMTKEQVVEEKLAIQKALLRFESIHGRPSSKEDRSLMHPLYDRYRNVKRMIARFNTLLASKGKESSMELQPILEHVAMDFTSPEHRRSLEGCMAAEVNEEEEETQNVEVEAAAITEEEAEEEDENIVLNRTEIDTEPYDPIGHSSNLHELSLSEMQQQQLQARSEKHRIRRILREFEDNFQKQTGRKAQKEDKAPMETTYNEYKHIKAKLKLLEALISKQAQSRKM